MTRPIAATEDMRPHYVSILIWDVLRSLEAWSLRLGFLFALALVCGNCRGKCEGKYNCPQTGGSTLMLLPTDLPAPVSTFATDPPCFVSSDVGGDGSLVGLYVFAAPESHDVTCSIRVKLDNGIELVGSATFRPIDADSCCIQSTLVASEPFTYVVDGAR